jgi:hypothetical protein
MELKFNNLLNYNPWLTLPPSLGHGESNLGVSGQKWHLGANPMARHREYYKGEGGSFLQVLAMMSLVSPSLPVAHPSIESAPAMH